MKDASILWRRLDKPGHESARVFLQDDSWNLQGTAVFSQDQRPCRLDYQIVCDSLWHTRSGKVAGWVGNIPVEIKIVVDRDLRWLLNEKDCPEIAG